MGRQTSSLGRNEAYQLQIQIHNGFSDHLKSVTGIQHGVFHDVIAVCLASSTKPKGGSCFSQTHLESDRNRCPF